MNIALLVYDISLTGGAEHVAINMARELSKYSNIYVISLFNQNKLEISECEDITVSTTNKSITKNLISFANVVRKQLVDNKIEILISITAGVVSVGALAVKRTDTKLLYAEHSNLENKTYGKKHQLRQWIGAKTSDCTITLTERDRNNFIKKYRLPEKKVICIPNWIEEKSINSEYKNNTKKIISAGRLEKVKGYDLMIGVAQEMLKTSSDWQWDIYGDGSLKNEIENQIRNAGLENNVFLKGRVNNIHEIYNEYSIFVMTSYYEGLPLVLLEAQSAKLPIVSFDCPTGPSDIISDGINGELIPTYDIKMMADRLLRLLSDENKLDDYSKKSSINLYKFSKAIVLREWLELFERVRMENDN